MKHLMLALGFLVCLLGLPAASYFTVFRPQNQEIARAKGEVAHMEALLEQLKAEAAKNADFERANQELKSSVAFIEQRLPTNQEIDNVVRQVSELAIASGLATPAIRTNKPVAFGMYMELPLEMETAGSFVGFHNFVQQVEALPRGMRLHSMRLQSQDRQSTNDVPELRVAFTLSIYFQASKDEEEVAMASGR